jgi:dolichyl-diphosphooligosaccharide--protein glycosyltransferase
MWLRQHTPEFDTISSTDDTTIVRRTGVLNWWDAGYYITTIAGRVPVSNPSQAGARQAADAYLDTTGQRGVSGLALEAIRYIIVDATISLRATSQTGVAGLYPALAIWAGVPLEQYVRVVYFPRQGGGLEARHAYLPSYYKSLLIRLMLTDGEALNPAPGATWAIQLETQVDGAGRKIEVIRSSRSFGTVAAFEAFQRYEADASWLVVGFSPFEPCVPLEAVHNVRLVHSSPTVALSHPTLAKPIPEVKVYQVDDR